MKEKSWKRALLLFFGLWFIIAGITAGIIVLGNLDINGGNTILAVILGLLFLPVTSVWVIIGFAVPRPGLVAGQPPPPGYTAAMNTIEAISICTVLIVGILLLFWFAWTFKEE
jgi:hypothetical protein